MAGISGAISPGAAGDAFGALLGPLAGVVSGLQQLAGTITSFVSAIAPSAVLEFNLAIRDLTATIGSALISALNIFSSVAREVGGILLPVMQELEPVFRTLAEAMGNEFLAGVKLVAVGLSLLAPLIQVAADFMQEYSKFLLDLSSVVVAVVKTIKTLLMSLFGDGSMKDTFKQFFDILRQVVKALVTFAATLAVLAGFSDTVKMFADGLAKEAADREARAGGLKAAGTNPAFADVAAILKQQQLAAFTAAGGGAAREKTDAEWLKEMAGALKAIEGGKSLEQSLKKWWNDDVVGGTGILGIMIKFVNGISLKIAAFFNRF